MDSTQAYDSLPESAVWSCCFGYPGEGGFVEYWREPDGTKWIVSNGSWDSSGEKWSCERQAP